MGNIDSIKAINKEILIQEIEKQTITERENLITYIKTMFKGERFKGIEEFIVDPYLYIIAEYLHQVYEKKISRLIINIPPGFGKTELITKMFPTWALGNNPHTQIISTGYSASLTTGFSQESRDIYNSPTYKGIFPRSPTLSDKQNTKDNWHNVKGGAYYATGTGGVITGKRANIFIIDDALRPDDAKSDIKRNSINNWFSNTVVSRLFNPKKDAIIIIQQRVHEDDLCGHLIEKMQAGTGEDYTILSLPAVINKTQEFKTRFGDFLLEEGKSLAPSRFSLGDLNLIKQSYGPINFECQYQQDPISKETQEFKEDWFQIYTTLPNAYGRVITTVDPAFSKKKTADNSAITTLKVFGDKIYILEQTAGKYNPAELEDVIMEHIEKYNPEVVGVEAIAAQVTISFSLKRRLLKEQLYSTYIEEIRQREDKEAKIRALIPLYRNRLIYHTNEDKELEAELLKFPRGKHDDRADGLQLGLYLINLIPNLNTNFKVPKIQYNQYGMPIITN